MSITKMYLYQALADTVLLLHALLVVFVVAGLLLTIAGGYRQWLWVRNGWFRVVHLGCIAVVVVQSWAGQVCPLTSAEMWLRGQTAAATYSGSFVQYWLQRLLYYDAPDWFFVVCYTTFGLVVVIAWRRIPPHNIRHKRDQ
ncbi:MAG: DUF2784 domain-containing protein [Halopseudomonas sp.]